MMKENNPHQEIRFDSDNFNNKLINSLPGIFYLYEVTEDDVVLKRWNQKHVTELEYPASELKNMSASVFYTKEEYQRVRKAIERVFETGLADIHSVLVTKSGRHIPYYLQGYALDVDGAKYFMGVGINEAEHVQLKKDIKKARKEKQKEALEKQKAEAELHAKERELLTMTIQKSHTSRVINEARKKLKEFQQKCAGTEIIREIKEIENILAQKNTDSNSWEVFKLRFKEVHPKFFDKLREKHPQLTQTETRFCAYLRLHLSNQQIASILNVSKEGIKKTRYRIRKKFGLLRHQSLEDYISRF